jgi:cysteine-S-conjugate beta-lyase
MDLTFDFDQPIDRRDTGSYKWDGNEHLFGRADLLPFWVADMDFPTPQPILAAIKNRLNHPVLGYGFRSDEYCLVIRHWLKTRHDWDVPEEWLMFCPPSSIVGIQGIVEALSSAGDSIVAPTPTYGPLMDVVVQNGRRLIRAPLREVDGRFELDIDDLETRLEADTRLVMLCSPNNPVGRVFTRGELKSLADVAERHRLVVVSDEVHCDLVMPGNHHLPYGMIAGDRSVTVISPNKAFNTAGIPQATLIIPDVEIRAEFQAFLDRMQLNHDSTFGALGMIAAYSQCGPWLDAVITYVDANHRFVADYFEHNFCGVRKVPAEATYLAWLDFRQTGLGQDEIMDRLVTVGGVGLYSGTDFGEEGKGFFRMNLACPKTILHKGLQRISKALQ